MNRKEPHLDVSACKLNEVERIMGVVFRSTTPQLETSV